MELIIKKGKWLLTLTITLLLSLNVLAADMAGQIIMVKGTAQARSDDGQLRTLKRRDPVFSTDTITTGDDSRVQIRFIDNGLLALQANSQLSIHSYRKADGNANGEVLMELVEGGFRTLTGTIGKGDKSAYKVDTPVASIGIRGTLYSALLRDGKLVAGVWKGGITLFTPDGQYDLGMGADYAFGTVGSDGFQGSITSPDELDNGPGGASGDETGSDDSGTDDFSDDSGSGNRLSDNDSGSTTVELPNPMDQDNDGNTREALEELGIVTPDDGGTDPGDGGSGGDGGNGGTDGPTLVSPDVRLSADEYTAFLQSSEIGAFLANGETVEAGIFRDDSGTPVFVSVDDNDGIDITRFRFADTAAVITAPDGIAGVEWGIWNGSAETPVDQYLDDDSLTSTPLESTLYWVITDPVRESALLALTGTVSFTGNQGIGLDGNGQSLMYSDGSFTLDFATGAISNGYINAEYGVGTPDNYISDGFWYANFDGSIRSGGNNTAQVSINLLDGSYIDAMTEGSTALDLTASQMQGVLIAPNADAFVGSFHFQTVEDAVSGAILTANGLVAWPQGGREVLAQ
ncbi:FecR family protein [Thalassolituus sp. LLYu03]|uniref:FecR family protein n=1 Tax=Thalassolituus sp. LLYu03 TaxID=3421656 RepID=UPI003D27CA17